MAARPKFMDWVKVLIDIRLLILFLVPFGRDIVGWLAKPSIDAAALTERARIDSLQAARFAGLKDWLEGRLDTIESTISEMPGAKEAARRRREPGRKRREVFGAADIPWGAYSNTDRKGEVIQ